MTPREPVPRRRRTEGIRKRHSRTCASGQDAGCTCRPSYEASVYLADEGKKLRRAFPTLAAAKAWREDALHAKRRGKLRAPTTQTVREAAEELLAGMREGTVRTRSGTTYKPASIRGYERALRLRVLPALGSPRLSEVRRRDVQDLADRLLADGLDASTIANTLDPLRVVFRRARRRDEVSIDPTEDLELPRPRGLRERVAAPDEARALLAALPEPDRALWATYAGLRRGELRALRWADVDLAGRAIRVRRAWDDVDGEQDVKSEAGRRRVPILAALSPLLRAHQLAAGRRGDDLVFGVAAHDPFEPSTVRRRALAAWKVAELRPIGLHEARHTCASTFIAAGANPKTVQVVMGHATIGMTFDRYGHLFDGDLAAAAARVDAMLDRDQHEPASR